MKRWTIVLLFATATVVAGCGGGEGRSASSNGGADATVALASTMISTATSEECPTDAHCVPWSVEDLVQVTAPDDAKTLDL